MFAGFCGHAYKNHICTVLAVTTGPLRANITLIWPSVKMSLTTCYSVAQWCSNVLARGPHLSFRNPSRAIRI